MLFPDGGVQGPVGGVVDDPRRRSRGGCSSPTVASRVPWEESWMILDGGVVEDALPRRWRPGSRGRSG